MEFVHRFLKANNVRTSTGRTLAQRITLRSCKILGLSGRVPASDPTYSLGLTHDREAVSTQIPSAMQATEKSVRGFTFTFALPLTAFEYSENSTCWKSSLPDFWVFQGMRWKRLPSKSGAKLSAGRLRVSISWRSGSLFAHLLHH